MSTRSAAWALVALLSGCATPKGPERAAPRGTPPVARAPGAEEPDDAARIVKAVRALYEQHGEAISAKQLPVRIYASEVGGDSEAWSPITEAALKAREETNEEQAPIDVARVYGPPGKARRVERTMTSLSGDWVKTVTYDFYPSGRLAFLFDEHFTYYGGNEEIGPPFVREERRYYAEDGRLVRRLVKLLHADTKEDVTGRVEVMFGEAPVYRDVSALPFR